MGNFAYFCFGVPVLWVTMYCLFFDKMTLLATAGIVALILGGIIAGIVGGLNVFGSGLNSASTKVTFVLTLGLSFYSTILLSSFGQMGIPFEATIDIILSTMFGLGLYLLATGGSNE